MVKLKSFSYVSLVLFLGVLTYLSGFQALFQSVVSLFFYSVIIYVFYFLWKKLRKKETLSYKSYLLIFFAKVGNILFLLVAILGTFSFYQNEVAPAAIPLYTLTDGKKQVQFQSMIHIGAPSFYKQVKNEIRKAKEDGFVLFFEGVRPGSDENTKKFDEAMGIKFDKRLYKSFGKLYGLTFQENSQFLDQVNNYDFNIDLSLDDIIRYYEEEKGKEENPKVLPDEIQDVNALVIDELSKLNPRELKILVYLNQSILNFLVKNDFLKEKILDEFGNPYLFEVILHKRNELLAKEILHSKYDKIFVTYGLLHFEGVFEILKKENPNWKIVKEESRYPIQN